MNADEYYNSLEKEEVNCPVCDSDDQTRLSKGDRYGMGVESRGCNRCGLIFINPRPTEKEMQKFYATNYRRYYESVEKPTDEYVQAGPFVPRANFVVDCISAHFVKDATFKVLDIGCAEGTLLKTISERFPNAELHGLEPDPNFAQFARERSGAKVLTGDFSEALTNGLESGFDLVTLTHVLEHVLNPTPFLQQIKAILKPTGYCYVEVPNISNDRTRYLGHVHLGHVLSFSPQNLSQLLCSNGLAIENEYLSGLPAKTPAMGFMTRRFGSPVRTEPLAEKQIEDIFERFKSKVAMKILI